MRALACAVLALLLWPALAWAHATVVGTTPGDTAVLKTAPKVVTMRFSEAVDLGPNSLRLLDATGSQIDAGKPAHIAGDRSTAQLAMPSGLKNGTYVVAWRVTSSDSHPVSGAFSFSIGAPSSLVTAAEPGRTGAAVRFADGIARGIAFAGFALAVGGAFVLLVLWPEGPASRRGRRLEQVGLGALMFGTVAVLLLQGPYATGGSLLDAFKPSLLKFSLSTQFGQALLLRIALTLGFAFCVARQLEHPAP